MHLTHLLWLDASSDNGMILSGSISKQIKNLRKHRIVFVTVYMKKDSFADSSHSKHHTNINKVHFLSDLLAQNKTSKYCDSGAPVSNSRKK